MFFPMTHLGKKYIQFFNIFPYGTRKCKKLDFTVKRGIYYKIKFFAFPGAIRKNVEKLNVFFS